MEFAAEIDRFEEDTAVLLPAGEVGRRLEAGVTLLWPRDLLPEGAREGSHLRIRCDLDRESTGRSKERIRGLLEELRRPRS